MNNNNYYNYNNTNNKNGEKKENTKMIFKHFPLNARVKIVNYDDNQELNGCIGHVRSKTKVTGRVKIHIDRLRETMKIPVQFVELCPLPMKVIGKQAQEYIAARVRMISACDEDQESTDVSSIEKVGFHRSKRSSQMKGTEGGACTSSLLKLLYDHQSKSPNENLSFGDIVKDMRQILISSGYQQTPQLSSSRPMQLTTPWEFVPSKNFSGKRRGLIIGVRYKGKPWELPGTHNDCHNMMKYLKRFHGFIDSDFTILMDDDTHTPPTRVNMLKAFRKFALECRPNDAVYFHFAGHGGSVPDESGDETDGMDETLYPMDYVEAGEILDDEVYEEFILNISAGVTLNAVVDSCHSGSVFDLPFELFGPGKGLDQDFSAVHFPHMAIAKEHRKKMERMKQERGRKERKVRSLSPQRTRAKKEVAKETVQQKNEVSSAPLPVDSTIIIVGLEKNPQMNGKTGVVKSEVRKNGRQHVLINGLTKSFALKPANMQLL